MVHAWKSSAQEAEVGGLHEFEDILVNLWVLGGLHYSLKHCLKTTTNPAPGPSLFVFVVSLKVVLSIKCNESSSGKPDFYQKTSKA